MNFAVLTTFIGLHCDQNGKGAGHGNNVACTTGSTNTGGGGGGGGGAALCAPVNDHLAGTCSAFGIDGLLQWLMAVISILVVACVLGVEALARARDARKPDDGRNRCAQGRASAASPRQKTSLPQLGRATTQLRPVVMLCLMSAASAVPLATNVNCLPYKPNEIFFTLAGAKPQHFLLLTPRLSAPALWL